jgi:sulfate adenylyltransferase subunit 1 (EFTu-like GTPase family)
MTTTELKTIKFLTAGHVDDGKSTLIGRLLHDIDVVPDDHIDAAKDDAGVIDYSLFTDGLEDERRQGITIDVAYRYFRHEGCRYRIADTPGHLEYMRNMAVAAVDSDVAVILVDAIHGVRLQTVDYSKIARFFGVRQFLVAINKMDAVGYSEARFNEIRDAYMAAFADDDTVCSVHFIPVSAKLGDNVVSKTAHTPWYTGQTLLHYLQHAACHTHTNHSLRLPIQTVVKDGDTRWYLGTLHGDALRVGDALTAVDSQQHVTVKGLVVSGKAVQVAHRRDAVAVSINQDVDISRGSVLSKVGDPALATEGFYADIVWLDKKYNDADTFQGMMKIHHAEEQVQITLEKTTHVLKPAFVNIARALCIDRYVDNPHTGLFILIDAYSERVVGVGTVNRAIAMDYGVSEAI